MVQITYSIFESYQMRYEDRLNVPMDRLSDQEFLIAEKKCYDGLVDHLKKWGVPGNAEEILLPIFDQVYQTSRFVRRPTSVSYCIGPVHLVAVFG